VLFLVVAASAATCAAQDKRTLPTPKQSTAPATQSSPAGAPYQTPAVKASDPHAQQDENPKRILGFIPNFQSKDDIPENQVAL